MHRYLAILWDPVNLESVRTFQSFNLTSASKPTEWLVACEGSGTFVMHTGPRHGSAEVYLLNNNSGVVLGRIFDRHHSGRSSCSRIVFDVEETRKIIGSAGQHLVDRYWGNYFAVVYDERASRHHVFRDPIGNVPCYHTRLKGVDIFFSHIEDCVRLLPVSHSVDRQYLARWLIFSSLTTQATGIEDVENVSAGERLTLSQGHVSHSVLWDPIAIASDADLERPDAAARALRTTVQDTIDAWASCYENITLRLSGGLDSSIVAGCLAHAPSHPHMNYLNLSIDAESDMERMPVHGIDRRTADKIRAMSGQGDERYFARLVADRWGTALIERHRTLAMDLGRLWNTSPSVSPAMYFATMETEDASLDLVKTYGTQAFFSGQGGDSLFLATLQALPAIDYAYLHGIRRGLWEQIRATSRLSRDSLWAVLGKAIRHGILRAPYAPAFTVLNLPTLVNEELTAGLTNLDFESNLAKRISRSSLPPGKKDHVKGLTWSAYYDFVFDSGKHADHIDPLNSQPVWELMLRIPTCTVLTGGISRGLARQAFADVLPAEIRRRQVKGTGSPFYQQLVRRNKGLLREHLLDGLLVKHGYLNKRKLEECLTAQDPSMTVPAPFILSYLAAEIWLQQWAERRQNTASRGSQLQNATL